MTQEDYAKVSQLRDKIADGIISSTPKTYKRVVSHYHSYITALLDFGVITEELYRNIRDNTIYCTGFKPTSK